MAFVVDFENDKRRNSYDDERIADTKDKIGKEKVVEASYAEWTINETMHSRCRK